MAPVREELDGDRHAQQRLHGEVAAAGECAGGPGHILPVEVEGVVRPPRWGKQLAFCPEGRNFSKFLSNFRQILAKMWGLKLRRHRGSTGCGSRTRGPARTLASGTCIHKHEATAPQNFVLSLEKKRSLPREPPQRRRKFRLRNEST